MLAKLFSGKFLAGLIELRKTRGVGRHLDTDAFDALVRGLYETDWNVYAKAPFAGPTQIFRYLGQYTHRVGISNHRLLSLDARGVTFRTRGVEAVTLDAQRFIERFLFHVLPFRFVKIRHSGLMANGSAVLRRERARALLVARSPVLPRGGEAPTQLADANWQQALRMLTGIDLPRPRCSPSNAALGLARPVSSLDAAACWPGDRDARPSATADAPSSSSPLQSVHARRPFRTARP